MTDFRGESFRDYEKDSRRYLAEEVRENHTEKSDAHFFVLVIAESTRDLTKNHFQSCVLAAPEMVIY